MSTPQTASEVFEQVHLDVRARLIELAAALDRIGRADEVELVDGDPRRQRIGRAIELLGSGDLNRAEQIQLLFSDEYDPEWNQA